jgi:Sugar transferases involved in lipopolysaccharide synthesis
MSTASSWPYDPKAQSRVRELNSRLRVLPNEVTLLVEPEGAAETNWALDRVAATPLASLEGPLNDDRRAFHKRIQDLILGSIALLLLAPVMGLIALAIKLDSPGPVFFRQRRHGFNHEEIVVWKSAPCVRRRRMPRPAVRSPPTMIV